MLINELFAAIKKVKPELSQRSIEEFSKTYHETIQRVYIMDRFDAVFTGSDRHVKCIKWILANEKLFNRYYRILNQNKIKEYRKIRKQINELELRLLVL